MSESEMTVIKMHQKGCEAAALEVLKWVRNIKKRETDPARALRLIIPGLRAHLAQAEAELVRYNQTDGEPTDAIAMIIKNITLDGINSKLRALRSAFEVLNALPRDGEPAQIIADVEDLILFHLQETYNDCS